MSVYVTGNLVNAMYRGLGEGDHLGSILLGFASYLGVYSFLSETFSSSSVTFGTGKVGLSLLLVRLWVFPSLQYGGTGS